MRTWLATAAFITRGMGMKLSAVAALLTVGAATALAQPAGEAGGGEASLKLPDLSQVSFFNGGIDGHKLLLIGILFCLFGLGFGMAIFMRLKNLPVHRSMREISELIYETCKTYLFTQGRFIAILWAFIGVVMIYYFGFLAERTLLVLSKSAQPISQLGSALSVMARQRITRTPAHAAQG